MTRRMLLPLGLLVVLVVGCLPSALQDATPDAAVLGVPAGDRVPGAADGLHDRLAAADTGFDFVPASTLRFLEVRSGLVGSRVRPGAARIARTNGAELAITIGPATLTRELETAGRLHRERVVMRLEVAIVRSSDATELARLAGPRLVGEKTIDDEALPPLDDDPLVASLREESLDALAPRVARELRTLAISGSSGE
ncbi:MAG: hypothetical protein U5J97_07475 [Trueperaceae bacterium]|nr:hypothetical protein [Trueperaceae bacterium]